jgi:hypothetical protein
MLTAITPELLATADASILLLDYQQIFHVRKATQTRDVQFMILGGPIIIGRWARLHRCGDG